MNVTRIDLDFQHVGSNLHCPVCGAAIVVAEEDIGTCPHLLFAWVDVAGGFLEPQTSPDFRALVEEDEEHCSPLDDAFLAKCPPHTVVFALTESGFGCSGAPSSITVAAGFRFPD